MAPVAATSRPHVVLLTFSGKGHINPFMMLAKELARRGLSITLVFTDPQSLSRVEKLNSDPTEGLDIHLVALPEDENEEFKKNFDMIVTMPGIRGDLQRRFPLPQPKEKLKALLEQMVASSSPPVAVMIDLLLTWAFEPVDQLHIPRFIFYTAAAAHLAITVHIALGNVDLPKAEAEDKVEVPGLPTMRWCDVPSDLRDPSHEFHMGKEETIQMLQCNGFLLNTSDTLEEKVIAELRKRYPSTTFIPIGPLCANNPTILQSDLEWTCKEWLDSRNAASVVYISFGSWAGLSEKQIPELALGIEASGVDFLWVLPSLKRKNEDQDREEDSETYLERVLPKGFQERTACRGLILTSWAPQQLILKHHSLGAFVTHCGWNSVTECIVHAGVPMLGWPFLADQPAICVVLVEELRVAVGIVENEDGLADRGEVERALSCLVTDQDLRLRAAELRQRVIRDLSASCKSLEDITLCLKKSCA